MIKGLESLITERTNEKVKNRGKYNIFSSSWKLKQKILILPDYFSFYIDIKDEYIIY